MFKKAYQRWLDKRIPRQRELTLTQRRIFIFPTQQGCYFLLVLLLLFIAAINYQNNLIYALVFFLASLFNTAIVFTYLNVSGLRLTAGKAAPVFAGDYVAFELHLNREAQRHHHQIQLAWPAQPSVLADVIETDQQTQTLLYQSQRRGRLKPGRLLLESHYPLGLLRAWSWLDMSFEVVVYPKPAALSELPASFQEGQDGREKPHSRADDFFGFRAYQAGDSLRHVDWRSVARGLPLQTKLYAAKEQQQQWADWHALEGLGVEERLSVLCAWVLALEQRNQVWGLRLPGVVIAPDQGDKHCHNALTHLALWGENPRGAHE